MHRIHKETKSVCRKCNKYHDKIQTTRTVLPSPDPNLQRFKNDGASLERALLKIAVQESLETHQQMRGSTDASKYAQYGSRIPGVVPVTLPVTSDVMMDIDTGDTDRINTKINYTDYTDYADYADRVDDARNVNHNNQTVRINTRRDNSDLDSECMIDSNTMNRVNIVVGRGSIYLKGNKNLPINPTIFVPYVIYVDSNEKSEPDIPLLFENIDFAKIGFSNDITDIRIYFDWSSFYCTAISNMTKILDRIKTQINRPVKVYIPLYPEDKGVPGDVVRHVISNKPWNLHLNLMLVYGEYPLFDWNDSRIAELRECVNESIYLMISTYEE
jgi:hypothetical protein